MVTFLAARNHEPELVWRCLGLLQTNGVTSHSAGGVATGHGLYPVFSITNHSCIANTRHATRDSDTFTLVAVVDIAAGEEITTSYKSSALGTIVRRPPLRQLWNFDCACRRCGDPTELGTQASAVRCVVAGCGGFCLPVDCLSYTSAWACDKCGTSITADRAIEITEGVQALYKAGGAGVVELEKTLVRVTEKVHPRHYIAMQVKRMLMLMYGNCSSHRYRMDISLSLPFPPSSMIDPNARFDSMSKAELQRKAELCREYLIIFSLLEPGLTKWRGRVCEELARTIIKLEGR